MSGVDAARLPALIDIDGVVGDVLPDVASALGLPQGVVVRAGMNDTQAGAFATGAMARPDRRGVMVGTTAVLIQSMPAAAVDLDHEILSMPAPLPGRFVVMAENGIAGRAVERALAVLSPAASTTAAHFAELESALSASRPGAGGLLFLPWLAGSMSPSSSTAMRGGYLGMTLTTERSDLLRATVEGVARNLRWLTPAVDELCGTGASEVVFAGGAARSPGVAQVAGRRAGHGGGGAAAPGGGGRTSGRGGRPRPGHRGRPRTARAHHRTPVRTGTGSDSGP